MIAKKCFHIAFLPIPFLILSLFLSKFYSVFGYIFLLLLLLQAFFIFFFRDLKREIQDGIVSPADGKIIENEGKISIFMSLFDMHVNLMPYDGKISKIRRHEGKHCLAFRNAEKNEKLEIEIDSDIGKIRIFQIAGFFARRIVPYVKEGDFLKKGEKIGIIRFGSRVELILPENCKIIVEKEKKVKAGERIAVTKYKNSS
ncbi:MAG: phosphatidylserine decarboxylase [Thermoplasmatales archaeon]|nr:phosphatidylserine decarboxylase [Thermoplasmatales archaeon]